MDTLLVGHRWCCLYIILVKFCIVYLYTNSVNLFASFSHLESCFQSNNHSPSVPLFLVSTTSWGKYFAPLRSPASVWCWAGSLFLEPSLWRQPPAAAENDTTRAARQRVNPKQWIWWTRQVINELELANSLQVHHYERPASKHLLIYKNCGWRSS